LPSPLKSPTPATDQPGDVADERGGWIQDLRRAHLPDCIVTIAVGPQDVGHAVAVEVSDTSDRPAGDGGEKSGGGVRDLGAVHQPDRQVVAGVAPQDVGVAIAVEVASADDCPLRIGHIGDERHGGVQDLGATHQPDG
jgi:hypothetical protein